MIRTNIDRDLAAIDASFGVLAVDDVEFGREDDGDRGEHLAELWRS